MDGKDVIVKSSWSKQTDRREEQLSKSFIIATKRSLYNYL